MARKAVYRIKVKLRMAQAIHKEPPPLGYALQARVLGLWFTLDQFTTAAAARQAVSVYAQDGDVIAEFDEYGRQL